MTPPPGPTPDGVRLQDHLGGVDWPAMKAALGADQFDNGRTPEELRRSFENSYARVIAYVRLADGEHIAGSARVLSDGVCNAYLVDLWTHSPHRRRGIARAMVQALESRLDGQHMALFSAEPAFYEKLGFAEERVGLSKVVGRWLRR